MKGQSIYNAIYRGSILVALCVSLLPATSMAQQYYDPGLLQKAIDRKPVDYQSPGVRVGGFTLSPGFELAYENNNNIFYLNEFKVSDNIIHARPWFNVNSDWSRHELNFSFYSDFAMYNDFDSQNYQDWVASIDGRIDVKRGSNFNYRASFMELHEDRGTPAGIGGVDPTTFSLAGFDVGYSHAFNRLTAALNYDYAATDYDNNIGFDGDVIDNKYRSYARGELRLKLAYELAGQRAVFFSAAANDTNYDQKFDNAGFERSSDGYDLRAGMSWDKQGVLVGDLYLQYINQDYDDELFKTVTGFGVGASLDWTPTKLTNVSFSFKNSPQETTLINTSGYYSSLYSARIQHELRRNWLLNARVSYTDNDYKLVEKDEFAVTGTQVTRAGAGISYLFNRHLYISGGYVYEKQDANVSYYKYKTNRWFLTFGAEL